jgi:FixJ family two-component response regulator
VPSDRDDRVFLVDDDLVTLYALEGVLRTAGYRIEAFDDPRALLSRLSTSDRGCVVVDLRLPGLSGLELQRILIDRGIALPLIFVSGSAHIPDAVAAMKQGAVDFLPKPVEPGELLALVERALAEDAELASKREARDRARARWATLSPREQDVCRQLAKGLLHKQIAAELGTVESTVQAQRTRAFKKLGLGSVADLIRLMVRAGEDG